MLCRLRIYKGAIPEDSDLCLEGRFVVQRHKDPQGSHLDIRLEQDGYLLGWRIEAQELKDSLWGQEKLPHDPVWLEVNEGVDTVLYGYYRMFQRDNGEMYLELNSEGCQSKVYQVERWQGFPARFQQAIWQCMRKWHITPVQVPSLIEDGITARERAIRKICGLGQFLEGDAFCTEHWEQMLSRCSLREIYTYLRKWEERFSNSSSAERVSRPEKIDETWTNVNTDGVSQEVLHLVLNQQTKQQQTN